jgi:hypothetical protein
MLDEQNKRGLSPVDARVNDILSASSPKFLTDGLGLRGTPTIGLTAPTPPTPSAERISFAEPASTGFQLGGGGFDLNFPNARGAGSSFPFWDWSKIQTNSDLDNPEYAYHIWFGKPKADSEYPSEVYTLSLYTSVENEGVTFDGTDVPRVTAFMADGAYANLGGDGNLSLRNAASRELHLNPDGLTFVDGSSFVTHSGTQLYGQYGGTPPEYDDDGNLVNAGNGGNNFLLKPDSDGVSLTLSDTTGSSLFANQDKVTVTDSSGSWASLLSSGSLELQDADGNHFTLYPYALTLTNSDGDSGTYEPHQLTISHGGDESYLSTSALRILTQTGDGTYEAHQATLRDQNGGVDLNTAEIKTYNSTGAYAALGSAGTLSLRNSSGNQLDLEAAQISFSTEGTSSTLDSYGLEVTDGSNKADVSVAQVEVSDSNGRSRLKPTMVQIIEGTDTGTYEAKQLTLGPSTGRQLFASSEYVALKDGSEDRAVLSAVSGSGELKCKSTTGGEGYYAALAMHIKGEGEQKFRADTFGWTVQDSAGTKYTSASDTQFYAESPTGHASMDPAGFEVSDESSNYTAIDKGKVITYAGDSWSSLNSNGSLQLSDGSGTATISQNSLYLTDGENYINMNISNLGGKDADWQEIDICVNGVPKKMKILGTEPY